jgi:hypothetical protein
VKSSEFQFVVNASPGDTSNGATGLYAIVSIKTSVTNEEVVSNKKLTLTFSGKYISEKVKLSNGRYKVTKFLLVNTASVARFATPVVGSPKAAHVQKPLAIDVVLPNSKALEVPLEVLKIEAGDTPQSFGYPAGTFNEVPGDGNTTFKIKVKAVFGIGDIVYDSIPASLTLTTWDSSGQMSSRVIELAAGANEVALSKAATKYQLKIQKWGKTDEMTLMRNQMQEGGLYSLGGNRAAKKLKLEETFLLVQGQYVPDAKTIYAYHGNGSLSQIEFYQKKPQHSELKRYFTDVYEYTGRKVQKINRYDEQYRDVGFTEFMYDTEDNLVNMHQKSYDQHTYAAVAYSYPTGHAVIMIDYLFSNGHAMEYKMKIRGGNKVEDAAITSTGGTEGGTYSYDFNINPFAHMNMPNIYLSNLSRSNLVGQQKGFGGNIPSGVPYKWTYQYDTEGYPVEVVRSYKSHVTGEHLYTTKTVYTY